MSRHDSSVEDQLGLAVRGVHDELLSLAVPDFEPSGRPGRGLAVLLLVVFGCAAGWLATSGGSLRVETPTATDVLLVDTDSTVPSEGSIDAAAGEFIVPLTPSWNADGSVFLLYRTVDGEGGGHELYDAETLEPIRTLPIRPNDIEQVFWSPVDPNSFFYFHQTNLMRYDVASSTSHFVESVEECGDVAVGPSPFSWDGDFLTFSCVDDEGGTVLAISQLGVARHSSLSQTVAQPIMLASGAGVAIFEQSDQGLELVMLDTELAPTGIRFAVADTNIVATMTAGGSDLLVGPSFDGEVIGSLVGFDPATGESTVFIGPDTGYAYPPSGTFVSAQAWQASGRIALGILGDPSQQSGVDDGLSGRVLLVTLGEGEPVSGATPQLSVDVSDVALHQSSGQTVDSDYWASPFVALDPTGQWILYSSDRGSGSSVSTFLVRAP